MKQLLLIVNPVAGMKIGIKILPDIISLFNQAEYDVHVYVTTKSNDAVNAVKKLCDGVSLIVCSGGDGTLNETINGLIQSNSDIPIGYIPAGSTNDYANAIGISKEPLVAAKQIINGIKRPYDIGKFGDQYFTYVASFGVFTKTSYNTPQYIKNSFGHLAYIMEGIQELSNLKRYHLSIQTDNDYFEGDYVFGAICNSTSIGGILALNPSVVDLSDGKFELFLVKMPRNIQELNECIKAIKTKEYDCEMLRFCSTTKLYIKSDAEMSWTLDGELAAGIGDVEIVNLKHQISIIH